MTTPLDLDALARQLIGTLSKNADLATEQLTAVLTQSRTAGRAEGLKAAALTADCFNCGVCGMDGKAGAAIRALASDPAPGEQQILIADRIFSNRRQWNLLDSELYDLITTAGVDGYGYCDWHFDDYDDSIEFDGCNPDFRLTKEAQDALWTLGFDRCWLNHSDDMESFYSKDGAEHYRYKRHRPASAPAHPTEPGEVERLRSTEVACPVCDSCADLGWCAKHNDALKEIERLRAIETAALEYRRLVWEIQSPENGRARVDAGCALDAALSAPRPAQPKGETE